MSQATLRVQKISGHLTRPLPLGELHATVPEELRTVVAKMTEKDPAQRYQTPGEVAAALAPFIKKATVEKTAKPRESASGVPAEGLPFFPTGAGGRGDCPIHKRDCGFSAGQVHRVRVLHQRMPIQYPEVQ